MEGTLYTTHFYDHLSKYFKNLESLPKVEGIKYANEVWLVYRNQTGGSYQHKVFPESSALAATYLRDRYGRGRFKEINSIVGAIKQVGQHYKKGSYTYPYRVTEKAAEAIYEYQNLLFNQELWVGKIVNPRGNIIPKRRNAIYTSGAKTTAWIPPTITINLDAVQEVYKHYIQRLRDADENRKGKLMSRCYDAIAIQEWASSNQYPLGTMPQYFIEKQSGRLYGKGAASLQFISSDIKQVILKGTGYIEYDISNCHYSIFYDMAQSVGVGCPGIKYYLDHKNEVRRQLALEIYGQEIESGIVTQADAIKGIKKALLAKINGASNKCKTWDTETNSRIIAAIPRRLAINNEVDGIELARRLYNNGLYKKITAEMAEVQQAVLRFTNKRSKKDGFHINEMGKQIAKSESKGKRLAHILQGAEAKVLNVVLHECEGNILVPRHDGWIAKESLDIRKLENLIEKETGFSLEIEKEKEY